MELILILGMFLSTWASVSNGFYQLAMRKHIHPNELIHKWVALSWMIGALITLLAVFYMINRLNEKREKVVKPKYELIQEQVYRKIK